MGTVLYEVGDRVWYPNPAVPQGIQLTVADRRIIYRPGEKSFVRYLYDGLLDAVVHTMQNNIARDYDNLIVITGKEGSGKSNLAYELCKRFDPDFTLEEGYVYEYDNFMTKLQDLIESGADRGKVFWMDEATNIASNREWMHKENKKFIQLLEMMRSRGWTLVLCIPSIERLDVYIREHRVRMNLITEETYWDGDQRTTRGYFELRIPKQTIHGMVGYKSVGYGRFPKMEPDEKKAYEAIKMRNQNDLLLEATGAKPKEPKMPAVEVKATKRLRLTMVRLQAKGYSIKEIAELTDTDISVVGNMLSKEKQEMAKAGKNAEADKEGSRR